MNMGMSDSMKQKLRGMEIGSGMSGSSDVSFDDIKNALGLSSSSGKSAATARAPRSKPGDDIQSLTPDQAFRMNALENHGYSEDTDRSQLMHLDPSLRDKALDQEYAGEQNAADFMQAPSGSKDEDDALEKMYASSKVKNLIGD